MAKQALISFKDFSFRYDSQAEPTLKNINLDIYSNEKLLILGPSGSGKSTLGRLLNGLIPQAFAGEVTGQARFKGKDLLDQSISDLSYQVGTVLQDSSAQFVGLSVAEDLAFALENDAVAKLTMEQAVDKWLNTMRLSDLASMSPQKLSGGQKQRVAMAGVLIDQPEILLFDEPLASLDPAAGYQTMQLINQLQSQFNNTVVIIEHRLEDVLTIPIDRIVVFDQGQIVYDGTSEALLKSDLLRKVGIREPLYVSALKYAGANLAQVQDIAQIDLVKSPDLADKVHAWQANLAPAPTPEYKQDLLTLQGISFAYPENPGHLNLKDISFNLKKGEMVSLVGTNGAGKSTLAKLIAGFVSPCQGQILWQGENITGDDIDQRAGRIGYVMQDPNQMISQTMIYDEIALGLRMRDWSEDKIQERVFAVMQACGIYKYRNWPISALSYGQKKRVTIAAILVLEPALIILDEPTAGQDYRHYTDFMRFICGLNQEGMTILMITHDLQLMLEYTERSLVLVDGQLLADRLPSQVLTDQDLSQAASLRPTSLFHLADKVGIKDKAQFVADFIYYEGQVLAHE
ncbi:heme ABC transporter ATP-binding protein [Aerococcus urinaehominis]|uniref:Heme ABC transporter ATP-binding protein n=1 Tax=Aerococcus urinaehominis TaxID=128944 RepID=A0A0X8FL95_9LACT|nr:ABC transporter ATP-binding protein [Aerococcus urinaehominis]AMB99392.1 heme ABC transporter ATP-binding protein [Aerococcus urinaehominis]SDM23592.1 energy-coupling factor transport system ATP-binding protein [Aerococcus urinaehominis]